MAQATDRIHEPTMEEILTSIRKIIAEEDTVTESPPRENEAAQEQQAAAENEADEVADRNEQVLAIHEDIPIPESNDAAEEDPSANDNRLLDQETDSAVAASFQQLTESLMGQDARTLEEIVSEMMRPMLQGWLNDNLPSLVERLVREEIERVSRARS